MAVEAHRLSPIFSSQFLPNRDMSSPIETNGLIYDTPMRYTTEIGETAPFKPMYNLAETTTFRATDYLVPHAVKPSIQSIDSSVTFHGESNGNNDRLLPVSSSQRKRSRDESVIVNPPPPGMPRSSTYLQFQRPCSDPLMFLGHDMSLNVQQHQLDVDRLISHHIEKMRMEIEEKRKRQGRRILEVIEQGIMRRLKAKDEEIEKIGKMNQFLEERVKSLCIENQIWRDLAQTNETTANALRCNLNQVLNAVERSRIDEPNANDAESCCGSSGGGVEEEEAQDTKRVRRIRERRVCRSCGEGEACVLVLPCRHLCLCTRCGSCLHTCPICKSAKNASVHVNLSS